MPQRIYHGKLSNSDLANALVSNFSRGNMRVQKFEHGDEMIVQISTSPYATSGGSTALSVYLQNVADGVLVEMSNQAWLGIAASLGVTTIAAISNPMNLLHRLDDLAQDIEYVQLVESAWKVIDKTARSLGSGFELSARLNRYICDYCSTPNLPGEPHCMACGAPLGNIQPETCKRCGYVVTKSDPVCPNCGTRLN